jgi:hypothetical protein
MAHGEEFGILQFVVCQVALSTAMIVWQGEGVLAAEVGGRSA